MTRNAASILLSFTCTHFSHILAIVDEVTFRHSVISRRRSSTRRTIQTSQLKDDYVILYYSSYTTIQNVPLVSNIYLPHARLNTSTFWLLCYSISTFIPTYHAVLLLRHTVLGRGKVGGGRAQLYTSSRFVLLNPNANVPS